MKPLICNGWKILFYPLFNQQWIHLVEKVQQLKTKLDKDEFVTHADVKLLKAIDMGIKQKIPQDPFASYFALKKPLQKYGRLKKMGLPSRYRLFFRAFKEPKVIIILWLGFPRKEGDRKDCYAVFSNQVMNGEFPEDLESLIIECQAEI
ncbi:type II toxin-antitoxin system YhaV family toxin [Planktothrix mougeotii]|uniref:Type II toxin-antitoxin system YhaV family toxin n=1 Tax=Planktothrix mougeotii LEGE 06226 TaxID=1828728 RepID=A0ABR9UHL8_9CYAN|nr:type II toxin-antitoxin system YhaV family toxin [Planktothrix mougeotii]MBE9145952.1 type II toxin-antitoxin system YhaV family toxin [Planktothrix mougeotii LEGE 06226]